MRVPSHIHVAAAAAMVVCSLPSERSDAAPILATRASDVLGEVPPFTNTWAPRPPIFSIDATVPVVWPPPPPPDPSRDALLSLISAPTNEFSAPPLLVTRISALDARSASPDADAERRFEVVRVRDTITTTDRLFREDKTTNAIAVLKELLPVLRTKSLQITVLNHIAAYHFRLQEVDEALAFMRRAYEVDPGDIMTACNLAATLLQRGYAEESLGILMAIPPDAINRPTLMFSIQFNLACAYSLLRRPDDAFRHLAYAVQADPASAIVSLGDPQLDSIRPDNRFTAIRRALEDYVRRAEQASGAGTR